MAVKRDLSECELISRCLFVRITCFLCQFVQAIKKYMRFVTIFSFCYFNSGSCLGYFGCVKFVGDHPRVQPSSPDTHFVQGTEWGEIVLDLITSNQKETSITMCDKCLGLAPTYPLLFSPKKS